MMRPVPLELFTLSIPETGFAEKLAQRAEAGGWDGIALTDSQNLVGEAVPLTDRSHRAH